VSNEFVTKIESPSHEWALTADYHAQQHRGKPELYGSKPNARARDAPPTDLWCLVLSHETSGTNRQFIREYIDSEMKLRRTLGPYLMREFSGFGTEQVENRKIIALYKLVEGEWIDVEIATSVLFLPNGVEETAGPQPPDPI
jgi:hypothetical protein